MRCKFFWQAAVVIIAIGILPAKAAAANCPFSFGSQANAKPNKLYLYFPTTDDTTFPNVDPPPDPNDPRPTPSSPLHRFDVADLPAYTGTAAELRDAIHDAVTDIYCEFNVQVLQTTTPPPTTVPRRNTIGIGTDANVVATTPPCLGRWWNGQSQTVGGDTGDAIAQDFARVWAGTFQTCATGTNGALSGSNSTTARWANSIGSTAAHEAGHNYGLSHADGIPLRANEDTWRNHLMRRGDAYIWAERTKRRHFSDNEYSILAANVGLAMDTMWNWDFINPNGGTTPNATKLRMEFLSARPSLILSWSYAGGASPWIDPILTGPTGTRVFKGTTYNVYQIEWSTGQPWARGPAGEVPSGVKFHVGATFSSVSQTDPEAIIVTDVRLFDASNNALPLHPRWMSFDAATFNQGSRTLQLRVFNLLDKSLILRDVVVRDLPRIMSIDAMVADEPISDIHGRPFQPWAEGTRRALAQQTIPAGGEVTITVADARKRPYVLRQPTAKDCEPPRDDSNAPELRCQAGRVVIDLFPATTMYITATVVDPKGERWDPKTKRLVTGPVESQIYYQIAGRRLPPEVRLLRR